MLFMEGIEMACGCSCGENQEVNLVYACSGAANTGMLADQVMRALIRDKTAITGEIIEDVAAKVASLAKA